MDALTRQQSNADLSPSPEPSSGAIRVVEDLAYGSAAGIVGKLIEYPFDTVKVRLQSQPDHLPPQYKGPIDCFKQSIRADGVASLYRGISAPLVGAAVENSCLFFFEGLGRSLMYDYGFVGKNEPLALGALWATGAFSGACTSVVLTPIELVKCKIQVPDSSSATAKQSLRPMSVIREIYRHSGVRGFWNGQMGTLIREVGGCAGWFGAKETVSELFYHRRESLERVSGQAVSPRTKALPLWQQALAGAMAGVTYNFLFFPADTIKSRMQTAPMTPGAQPRSFGQEFLAVWRQMGIRGLYRGCGITCLRSAPSSAFIFMVYDGLKRYFPMT
ncbi:amino acid transporter arg-13 [Ceratocystis lukuohia]|uniref:Amino acid transporter arg-13 n=1 Tax=Ceratocystis lukuohia TaxID=2019550 RepID=A0ABR4MLN9_9PEZI